MENYQNMSLDDMIEKPKDEKEIVMTDSIILKLNEERFNDFLRCMSNLKEVCNDVDIRGGIIRQRSNDKTSIFEIDMINLFTGENTSILPEQINIAINDIKKKIDLLKTFAGQEVTLEIVDGNPGYFKFSDIYSSLKFISPSLSYMDNKFMTTEELNTIFAMNDDDLVLTYDLSSTITERIRIITGSFNTAAIQVVFEGETASIKAATQAKDQFANFIKDIPTNIILENCSGNLSIIPFSIEHDTDVVFEMYKEADQDISLNKFATNLGDVDFTIFTRSSIVSDED
jgi:hypothetical protein